MGKFIDLTGQKFGKLTVIKKDGYCKRGERIMWLCECECGNTSRIRGGELKKGQKYCGECGKGCPTHGLSHLPEYNVWHSMKQRCNNSDCANYPNYGGRGIGYDERWEKFEKFYEDMGARPAKHLTLERKKNDLGYSKDNCVWDTRKVQARNVRRNHTLEYNGKIKCISEWGEFFGLKHDTIAGRLERGWSIEKTLTTKAREPKLILLNGKNTKIREVEKVLGFTSGTICHRLKAGYTEKEAVELPFGGKEAFRYNKNRTA